MSRFTLTRLGHSHDPEADHCLRVTDLHVHYGKICALKGVNFEIGCGHCVGLLGRNGAGKSTLLKTLAGLTRVRSGSVSWRGRPVAESRREIAYLPQVNEMDVTFPLNVRGWVEMGRYPHLGPRRRWRSLDREVVEAALRTLGLEELAGRRLYQLSGGQRQRAQIARALAQEAHVLLLDEPFAGLDEPSRILLGALLRELAENGRLLLVCHHDLLAVPELFDRVLLLNREMVGFGPTAEVFTTENRARIFPAAGGPDEL